MVVLSIAITLNAVGPFPVLRRRIAWAGRAVLVLARFGLGLLVGVVVYGLAAGLFTSVCTPGCLLAPVIYATGVFLGAMWCVPAATLAAPDRLAAGLLPWISAAAVLLPVGIFSQAASAGDWYPQYTLYLAAAFCGSLIGTSLSYHILGRRLRVLRIA